MSQGLLNLLFSTVTKLEKAKSRYLANYFLSSKGLKSSLLRTISRNEEIRYGIFHDKFKEQRALANSEGLENLDRLYSNSLM